ncbi:MAG: hypothetical protein J5642_04570 [Bacteroidales bacterium]|nr:hypothetical protein [Bacteroidales bacterium]
MKVLSIIAAALAFIGVSTAGALVALCKTDFYIGIMLFIITALLFFISFSVFAIMYSFKKK